MKTFDDAMGRVFRKHTMESTVFSRYRTLFLLCCGCTTFFVLHNAFGGLRTPSAGPVETFPRKIWQSWKLDALRFEARDAERAMTWTKNNPSWRYEVSRLEYCNDDVSFLIFPRSSQISPPRRTCSNTMDPTALTVRILSPYT